MFRNRQRTLTTFILMLGLFAPLSLAAPGLKINPPPSSISIGENATLTLVLDWPSTEGPYEIHSLEPKLENLELVDQNQSQETGSIISYTVLYAFRPLKKGSALIYPFEISYRKSEADPWIPILVPEHKIRVDSGVPLKSLLTGMMLLCATAAAGFAIFKIIKKIRQHKASSEMPAPDPKQRVYANAEEDITTFASPEAKLKLTFWSNHLRPVVAAYYDVPANHGNTSAELLSYLKVKGIPVGEWNEVSRLFEELNEMQFSRQDIPAYDLDRMQKTLLQYIKGKIIIENSDS